MIMSTPISFHSSAPSMLQCNNIINYFNSSIMPLSLVKGPLNSIAWVANKRNSSRFTCRADLYEDDDYLIDAPLQVGDGFYFAGGKYSNEPSPTGEWFKTGKFDTNHSYPSQLANCNVNLFLKELHFRKVEAYPVSGAGKAKDPIFGLTMGDASQTSEDLFRWFCVESGSVDKHSIVLIHGLPSQAYSYRKVLPILSKNYHVIAFDWLGFGFSDKPQSGYGFDYTLDDYVSSFEFLLDQLPVSKVSLVCQGYFSPAVVKYASIHQERIDDLILLNPPLTGKHANLPSTLSIFSNFLLGEIFSQDPLRASDKVLTSCGPYKMKEEDAMVYRSPYLSSGSSGFALNAISRTMKKELKESVEGMRRILMDKEWKVHTTICWGHRDRWLSYDGVEDFTRVSKHKLVELPMMVLDDFRHVLVFNSLPQYLSIHPLYDRVVDVPRQKRLIVPHDDMLFFFHSTSVIFSGFFSKTRSRSC